ncbi:MAG: D-alanine--D-alanine ligase [Polyangiaceae bacterium]
MRKGDHTMKSQNSTMRVGVLMGGVSREREVSIKTGRGVCEALEARGYDVVPVMVSSNAAQEVAAANIDVAFIALHGRGGEDGCIQGMLELMGIPYTGSGVLSSALCMDKLKAKELFRLHNVSTPPYYVVSEDDDTPLAELHGSFGFPAIVKPRGEGSSVGLARVENLAELEAAVESALELDHAVLVERCIKAKEVHVGILNGRVLGAVEVAPKSGLYDYAAKYTAGATDYHLPPRVEGSRMRGVLNLAERAANALGCSGACRVDVLVTEGENEYVLEVNTLPGMTPTSLLPKIAGAAGIDYGALCEAILESATLHARLGGSSRKRQHSMVVPAAAVSTDTLGDGADETGDLQRAVGE